MSDDHHSQEVPVRNNPRLRTLMGRERPAGRFSVCKDSIVALADFSSTVQCLLDEDCVGNRGFTSGLEVQELDLPRVLNGPIEWKGMPCSSGLVILLRSYGRPVKPTVSFLHAGSRLKSWPKRTRTLQSCRTSSENDYKRR